MNLYIISYDLKAPGRNYEGLIKQLKLSAKWWHYLESTWLVVSADNLNDLNKKLIQHLDSNDRLLVIQIKKENLRNGWLPPKAWEWIKENWPK